MKFYWKIIFLTAFLADSFFASGKNSTLLFYQPSSSVHKNNIYVQGSIEQKSESKQVHLQFVRNWQLSKDKDDKLFLQEWGQKYQGTDIKLSELSLPGPDERVERVMDKLGRVEKVSRYPPGHRYYLNLLVFPAHPVSIGEKWKYDYQLNWDISDKTIPASCQIFYQLDKLSLYREEYYCAKILIQGSCQAYSGKNLVLDYRFQGKAFFDIENGREIDYQMSYSWTKSEQGANEPASSETTRLELYSIFEK